jgi:hypothetical protein
VQLFVGKSVRRFVGLAILLFFAVPFGLSVTGCKKALAVEYCNSSDAGPVVGQVANITLPQNLLVYGESLTYGQIGQSLSASATDCKGNAVSVSKYVYASTDGYTSGTANQIYADIDPGTGRVCAGTWNRNTGGGVQDYTTCTAPPTTPPNYLAYVTATAEGASSDAIPIFVHAAPNSIQIVQTSCNPTATPNTCATDPTTDACPLTYTAPQPPAAIYSGTECISQGITRRLIARVLDTSGNNITCQVGHITFAPVGATNIVNIDENGAATAAQPGSATITASVAGSSSSSTAGFYSTCAPKTITLTSTNVMNPVVDTLGTSVPFNATVTDTMGNAITGLALTYVSTTPSTIPAGSSTITPTFPGSATITAVCQPPTCNPSAFAQIDYLHNGTPLTSNGIQISAPGPNSSVLYVGSTTSQYLYPLDFTNNQAASLLKLPYVPNSMVIDPTAGASLYLGSSTALMTVSTATNSITSVNTLVTGPVISISPDGTTLVVSDPIKQTITLVSSSGTVEAINNGVATRAAWSPDSQTVYIITTGVNSSYPPQIFVHNSFTGWINYSVNPAFSDVAVTVPHIGAYFAGTNDTQGISYCPTNTLDASVTPANVSNTFYQSISQSTGVANERIIATDDKAHIIGAQNGNPAVLNDFDTTSLPYTSPCTQAPTPTPPTFTATNTPHPLTGVNATDITGVIPASNSAAAFVTYTGTSTNPVGILPIYFPAAKTASAVTLSGGAIAPVAGVFSSNDAMFFVGTTGDNLVHEIALTYPTSGNPTAVDLSIPTPAPTNIVTPNLPDAVTPGAIATPNLLAQRPKRPTN